jgi:hypothetical protein
VPITNFLEIDFEFLTKKKKAIKSPNLAMVQSDKKGKGVRSWWRAKVKGKRKKAKVRIENREWRTEN